MDEVRAGRAGGRARLSGAPPAALANANLGRREPPRPDPGHRRRAVRGARLPRRLGRRPRRGLRDLRPGALQALPQQGRDARGDAGLDQRGAARGRAAAGRRGAATPAAAVRALVDWHVELRAAPPVADRRPGPRLGVAAPRGPRAGAHPAARVRRPLGRPAAARPRRPAARPGPGDGARGVRPDQLHARTAGCCPTPRCTACCATWRCARSPSDPPYRTPVSRCVDTARESRDARLRPASVTVPPAADPRGARS